VQDYDVALKLLIQGSATFVMRQLTGMAVAKWLDVELPKVQNLRLDLLGETVAGGLIHVELQSSNDAAMPLRMAEYCLGIFRLFGRFPQQIVLYVGEPQLRMESKLHGPDILFEYRLIDIRTLDGDRLLVVLVVSPVPSAQHLQSPRPVQVVAFPVPVQVLMYWRRWFVVV
jgi:hypothetical protein